MKVAVAIRQGTALVAFIGAAVSTACDSNSSQTDVDVALPSATVNAGVVPAPTDTGVNPEASSDSVRRQLKEATTRARPFDLQHAPEPDSIGSELAARLQAINIDAHWGPSTQAPPPPFAGLDGERLDAARAKVQATQSIELQTSGRMRLLVSGGASALLSGSVIWGRPDRSGWLLSWPDADRYRSLPAGSLLAVLREARADAASLIIPRVEAERPLKERRFGFPLLRTHLTTNRGSLTLDQVEIPEAESAGIPLCRLLLELLVANATAAPCSQREIPVRAHFEFPGVTFDWIADNFRQRAENVEELKVPPDNAEYVEHGLPSRTRPLLDDDDWVALKKADHRATLRVINRDQVAAIVTWEGTPIGFVRPHAVLNLSGLPQGEFRIGVRDFFGAELNPVKPTKLENTSELSWRELSDAGTK